MFFVLFFFSYKSVLERTRFKINFIQIHLQGFSQDRRTGLEISKPNT